MHQMNKNSTVEQLLTNPGHGLHSKILQDSFLSALTKNLSSKENDADKLKSDSEAQNNNNPENIQLQNPIQRIIYSCKECSYRASSTFLLQRHMKNHRSCQYCDKRN